MKKKTMVKIPIKNTLITDEEIQEAINKLKKGEASDNNGIHAEDIKNCEC